MAPTVLITGAAGNLGQKLWQHLASLGWGLRGVDVESRGFKDVHATDLSVWDDTWAGLFKDVDAVIHLAGRPSPRTSWSDAVRYNFDLTQNVYEAAVRHNAKRLIFASSNWTMVGHRFDGEPLTTDRDPYPINPYGVSKLVGERLGKSYHERWGLSVICFRIGYCQRGENAHGPHMGWNSWGQLMWLSDRDFCNAMERGVLAEGIGFEVLNLMSDNPGMRWDIEATKRKIGYTPKDGAAPLLTEQMKKDEEDGRRLQENWTALHEMAAERRW